MPTHKSTNTARIRGTLLLCAMLGSSSIAGISRHDRELSYHEQLGSESRFQAAGAITFQGQGFASGTLIAPGWVLTAAHATEIAIPNQLKFVIDGQNYAAAETFEHPLWNGVDRIIEGYDIALIRLADPISNIDPAELYRGSSIVGRQAMLVGAGLTGEGINGQVPGTTGTIHAGLNMIDATADELVSFFPDTVFSSNGIVIDFDAPAPFSEQLNRIGDAEPLEYEFFPGQGDSGGAYWVEDNDGSWRIASIQSWGSRNYTGDNFGRYGNMAVSAALYEASVLSWIDGIVPAPGTLSVLAPIALFVRRRR